MRSASLLGLACATLVAALLAGAATAGPGLRVGIQDDAWLQFGPGTIDERVDRLESLGVELVRVTLEWRKIEASRGTYDWERADGLLETLRRSGLTPIVTRRFVDAAHRAGIPVKVWTVNGVGDMRRLLSKGVDALITDHPDVARSVLSDMTG